MRIDNRLGVLGFPLSAYGACENVACWRITATQTAQVILAFPHDYNTAVYVPQILQNGKYVKIVKIRRKLPD